MVERETESAKQALKHAEWATRLAQQSYERASKVLEKVQSDLDFLSRARQRVQDSRQRLQSFEASGTVGSST